MTWKKVFMMLCGAILLAIGGCGMFLAAFNSNGPIAQVGGGIFLVGVLMFLVAMCIVLVKAVKVIFTKPNPPAPGA